MKEVTEEKIEGKRGPGRKRIGMIDELIEKEWLLEEKGRGSARMESMDARELPCG